MIQVHLKGHLKDYTRGTSDVEVDSARDLGGVVAKLDSTFPGIGGRIVDDQGRIRQHVNVFVNSENSR